jgi:endonuclease/exonuclease/phosphatase (EEP) superfamily protein YafD
LRWDAVTLRWQGTTSDRRRLAATTITWLLVGVWAGWTLIRLFGLERGFPLVPALAFTPYVAATAVIPVAVAAALRRWAAATVALAAALTLAALLLPRGFGNAEDARPGDVRLDVMTANVRFGEADSERILDLVHRHGIDVLAVQELTRAFAAEMRRGGLARELPYRSELPAPNATGSGIYSRHPLVAARPAVAGSRAFQMVGAGVRVPRAGAIEVIAVHPPPPTGPTSVRDWSDDLDGLPAAGGQAMRLLLGDFNATLDHDRLRDVIDRGYRDAAEVVGEGLTPTWSSPRVPLLPIGVPIAIDHLIVDERIRVGDVGVHDLPGSDHDAVTGRLFVPPRAGGR